MYRIILTKEAKISILHSQLLFRYIQCVCSHDKIFVFVDIVFFQDNNN